MIQDNDILSAIKQYGFAVRPFKGRSMLPLLVEGRDAVKLVVPEHRLKKFDIALYLRDDGIYVLHRVIKVREDSYFIRGDNCLQYEIVSDSRIIAVAEGLFVDGEYYACSDRKMLKYARRQGFTLPFRKIKYYMRRALKKDTDSEIIV